MYNLKRFSNKSVSLLLAVIMILGLAPAFTMPAHAAGGTISATLTGPSTNQNTGKGFDYSVALSVNGGTVSGATMSVKLPQGVQYESTTATVAADLVSAAASGTWNSGGQTVAINLGTLSSTHTIKIRVNIPQGKMANGQSLKPTAFTVTPGDGVLGIVSNDVTITVNAPKQAFLYTRQLIPFDTNYAGSTTGVDIYENQVTTYEFDVSATSTFQTYFGTADNLLDTHIENYNNITIQFPAALNPTLVTSPVPSNWTWNNITKTLTINHSGETAVIDYYKRDTVKVSYGTTGTGIINATANVKHFNEDFYTNLSYDKTAKVVPLSTPATTGISTVIPANHLMENTPVYVGKTRSVSCGQNSTSFRYYGIRNHGNVNYDNFKVYYEQPNLKAVPITYFYLNSSSNDAPASSFKVICDIYNGTSPARTETTPYITRPTGTADKIVTLTSSATTGFTLGANEWIKNITIVWDTFAPGERISFQTYTNDSGTAVPTGVALVEGDNVMTTISYSSDLHTKKAVSSGNRPVLNPRATLTMRTSVEGYILPKNPGEIFNVTTSFCNYTDIDTLRNPAFYLLLPAGIDIVTEDYDGTVTTPYKITGKHSDDPDKVTFTRTPDYKGTGRTLVKWEFQQTSGTDSLKWGLAGSFAATEATQINYKLLVTSEALQGGTVSSNSPYFLRVYMKSLVDGVNLTMLVYEGTNFSPDTYDVDNDPSTTQLAVNTNTNITHQQAYFFVNQWPMVNSTVTFKGDMDSDWLTNDGTNVAKISEMGTGQFKISIKNNGNVNYKNLKIMDILPMLGDDSIVTGGGRGSTWTPVFEDMKVSVTKLNGTTTAIPGTFQFSTASNPDRFEMGFTLPGTSPANWTAGIADPSTLSPLERQSYHAFLFKMGAAAVLAPGETMDIVVTLRAPAGAPKNIIANNSFVTYGEYASGTIDNNLEQIDMKFEVETSDRPIINGFTWLDANHNGVVDTDETGINGVKVTLHKWSDNSIVQTTYTINNYGGSPGYYAFANITADSYYVTFDYSAIPGATAFTVQNAPGNTEHSSADSDADPATGKTGIIHARNNYTVSGINAGLLATMPIVKGYIWDAKGTGATEPSMGNGVTGVRVHLKDGATTIESTTSGFDGSYVFSGLTENKSYDVEIELPSGSTLAVGTTNPQSAIAENDPTFVNFQLENATASIKGRVWYDANQDSIRDANEKNGNDISVLLRRQGETAVVATTTTDINGYYSFNDLSAGVYDVEIGVSQKYIVGIRTNENKANPANNKIEGIILAANEFKTSQDAALLLLSSVEANFWYDKNKDGIKNENENWASGVKIEIFNTTTGETITEVTDAAGYAGLGYLKAGVCQVRILNLPADVVGLSSIPAAQLGKMTANIDKTSFNYVLSYNEVISFNAGLLRNISDGRITGTLYDDVNENGVYNSGTDTLLNGVAVELCDEYGNAFSTPVTTTTNVDGVYLFENLSYGKYVVKFTNTNTNKQWAVSTSGSDVAWIDNTGSGITEMFILDESATEVKDAALQSKKNGVIIRHVTVEDVDGGTIPMTDVGAFSGQPKFIEASVGSKNIGTAPSDAAWVLDKVTCDGVTVPAEGDNTYKVNVTNSIANNVVIFYYKPVVLEMTVNHVKNSDGVTAIAAQEKIKVHYGTSFTPEAAVVSDWNYFTGIETVASVTANKTFTLKYKSNEDITDENTVTITIKGMAGAKQLYSYPLNVLKSNTQYILPAAFTIPDYAVTTSPNPGSITPDGLTTEFIYNYVDNMTTVTIKAVYDGTSTPVEGFTEFNVPAEKGSAFTYAAPSIAGVTITGNSMTDNKITVASDGSSVITFYYKKTSGNVTVIYVDDDNSGQEFGRNRVSLVTGAATEIAIPTVENYTAVSTTPESRTFDGVNTPTDVTYHYTKNKVSIKLVAYDNKTGNPIAGQTPVTVPGLRVLETYNYFTDIAAITGYTPALTGSTTIVVSTTDATEYKVYYQPLKESQIPVEIRVGSKTGDILQSYTIDAYTNESVTITAPTLAGYTHDSANTDNRLTTMAGSGETLMVIMTDIRHIVTVNTKLGTAAKTEYATYKVADGYDIEIFAPYVAGHVLKSYTIGAATNNVDSSFDTLTLPGVDDGMAVTFNYITVDEAANENYVTLTIKGMTDMLQHYSYTKRVAKSNTPITLAYPTDLFAVNGYALAEGQDFEITPDTDQTVTAHYVSNMTTVTIKAVYQGTTTPVESFTTVTVPAEIGKAFHYNAPSIAGFDNTGSSVNPITPTNTGTDNVITFYYTKASGDLTVIAMEGTIEIGRFVRTVVPGAVDVTDTNAPTTAEIPAVANYTLVADSGVATPASYDGVNDVTLTYQYTRQTASLEIVAYNMLTNTEITGQTVTVDDLRIFENYDYSGDIIQSIAGYTLLPQGSTTVLVDTNSAKNIVKVYYEPDKSGTIQVEVCADSQTGTVLYRYSVYAAAGETVTLKPSEVPTISGYSYNAAASKPTAKEGTGEKIIIVMDDDRFTITVNVAMGTNSPVFHDTIKVIPGDDVHVYAPYIPGYMLSSYVADGETDDVTETFTRVAFMSVSGDHTVIFNYRPVTFVGDKSSEPTVNRVKEGDNTIIGKGEPGAVITVTLPNGDKLPTTVNNDGSWSVDVPVGLELKIGDEVKATQTEDGKAPSDEVTTQVGQVYRTQSPTVDPITEGDNKITGTGVPGAEITVTLPNGDELSSTVDEDGYWSVNVPAGSAPKAGEDVKIIQAEDEKAPSNEVTTQVGHKNQTQIPTVDPITEGDDKITGTGIPGAEITVTLPNGDKLPITVDKDGNWTVDIPAGLEPKAGDEIKVIQIEDGKDTSGEVTATVGSKGQSKTPIVDPITEEDNKITGKGEPGAGITVTLPDGGKLTTDVDEDGNWTVDIPIGSDPKAGDKITVIQTEDGKDPSGEVTIEVNREVQSKAPTVDPITEGDDKITGTGVAGAKITVTLPNGEGLTATVGNDGTWTVTVPANVELQAGDKIKAVQTEDGKTPSGQVTAKVDEKTTGMISITVTSSSGSALSGATVKVTFNSDTKTYIADESGKVTIAGAEFGSYTIQASKSGYTSKSAATTLSPENSSQNVTIALSTYGGSGGGGGGNPTTTATLIVRSIDKATGKVIYEQSSSVTVGQNKTVAAPSISDYTLDGGTPSSQTVTIKSGENIVIFNYNYTVIDNGNGNGNGAYIGMLESDAHIKYINGYPDGSVKPDNSITRAEVAAIFFRLIKDTNKTVTANGKFSDVNSGEWYAQAINYLASIGILKGYEDGLFHPEQTITRAEFAAIASRFDKLEASDKSTFSDVDPNHWAADYINSAYLKGWIGGYPDGSFRTESSITRAEVVKIVNSMLNRKIELSDIPADAPQYTDLAKSHWAYCDIIEASTEHVYDRKENGYELWK